MACVWKKDKQRQKTGLVTRNDELLQWMLNRGIEAATDDLKNGRALTRAFSLSNATPAVIPSCHAMVRRKKAIS